VHDCVAPSVLVDESEGVYHAVKELHAMGHRDIAHVTLQHYADPSPANPYRHAYMRYAGYKRAVDELKLPERVFTPKTDEITVAIDFDMAEELSHSIAREKTLPTAIVAYSDFESAGLLAGFHDNGIKVPEQISLVGYGHQQFNRMARPTLASITPAYERMGEYATQTLLTMIDGGEGKSIKMAPSLVMRQSVKRLDAKPA
jgi:LacI family transcriptional regulator